MVQRSFQLEPCSASMHCQLLLSFSTGLAESDAGESKNKPHLHTNLGLSAVIWTADCDATDVPAFVMTLPLMATLPCAIQDWMTLRLCSGYCSRHTSSSLLFFGACKPWMEQMVVQTSMSVHTSFRRARSLDMYTVCSLNPSSEWQGSSDTIRTLGAAGSASRSSSCSMTPKTLDAPVSAET